LAELASTKNRLATEKRSAMLSSRQVDGIEVQHFGCGIDATPLACAQRDTRRKMSAGNTVRYTFLLICGSGAPFREK
jgi:hypothetical protein